MAVRGKNIQLFLMDGDASGRIITPAIKGFLTA